MRYSTIVALWIAALGSAGSLRAQPAPDSALYAMAARFIADSVKGGGVRVEQQYIAADSISAAILGRTGAMMDVARPTQLTCPGSTTAAGQPVPLPVGYTVRVTIRAADNPANLVLSIGKTCIFLHQGRTRLGGGFGESVSWEVGKGDNEWYVIRKIGHVIT